jgi:acyl carrier protein phosphodiesterase
MNFEFRSSNFEFRILHSKFELRNSASDSCFILHPSLMNYLAHLFLAARTPDSLLGNLAGDFVKGVLGDQFRPAVRQGIVEHRKIDEFTDTHPSAGAFRRIIAAEQGHYAGVISDVFLDHFLACDWDEYSDESFDDFLKRVFATLDPLAGEMPGHLPFVYQRMRDGRWLQSYSEPEGIATALRNLSRRFARAPRLESSVHLLRDRRDDLQMHFRAFFPEAIAFVNEIRSRR